MVTKRRLPEPHLTAPDDVVRALERAIEADDPVAVRAALAAGACPRAGGAAYARRREHRAPLEHAAARGALEAARELLAHGATARDGGLWSAAEAGHLALVDLLLADGAPPEDGLPSALEAGQLAVAERLLAAGAELGADAVGWAVKSGRPDVLRLVLDRGAVPGASDLSAAADLPDDRGLDALRLLLDAGARPAASGETRWDLPLHVAAARGNSRAVAALLAAGAPAEATDEEGLRAVDVAVGEAAAVLEAAAPEPALSGVEARMVALLREDLAAARRWLQEVDHAVWGEACEARVARWRWAAGSAGLGLSPAEALTEPAPRLVDARPRDHDARKVGLDRLGHVVAIHDLSGREVTRVEHRERTPDGRVRALSRPLDADEGEPIAQWARIVEGERQVTLVTTGGWGEAYEWEGPQLVRAHLWSSLEPRARRRDVQHFRWEAGRLQEVRSIDACGEGQTVFRRRPKGESVAALAGAVEELLVRAVPRAVARAGVRSRAYCVALAGCEGAPLLPSVGVGLEAELEAWRARGDDESPWSPTEFEHFATPALVLSDMDPDLAMAWERLVLARPAPKVLTGLLRRAATALAAAPWRELLDVTDDFFVLLADLDGEHTRSHLVATLGRERLRALERTLGPVPT